MAHEQLASKKPDTIDDNTTVTLTMDQLNSLVGTITEKVMAGLASNGALGGMNTQGNLGEVIGRAVSDGMVAHTRPKVSIGQYLAKRNAGRAVLARTTYQNDKLVDAGVLDNEEIDLLNKITRSGRYIDRKVEVLVGSDGVDEVVVFRYHDKTKEQQWALVGSGVINFKAMLRMIVNEQQAALDAEERESVVNEQKRRHFGSGKNTREAEARVGA